MPGLPSWAFVNKVKMSSRTRVDWNPMDCHEIQWMKEIQNSEASGASRPEIPVFFLLGKRHCSCFWELVLQRNMADVSVQAAHFTQQWGTFKEKYC